jgi:hypothetical protein
MASIVGSAKYGEGHKVILKEGSKMSATAKSVLTKAGYVPGQSIFSIVRNNLKTIKVAKSIAITAGNDIIYMKDNKNKVVLFSGSASALDNIFNHYSENSKSNTGLLTEIKELISMYMFEAAIENSKTLTEDQIRDKLGPEKCKYYDTVYYESALKQTKALKKQIKSKGFHYERQGKDKTEEVYKLGRLYSKKSNDNWNPADVWLIKKTFDMTKITGANSLDELNNSIANAYKKGEVYPVSLKQVTSAESTFSVIDASSQMNQKLEYDFNFEKVDLSDTFANFIVQTKSGFAVRCGFKASATTLNVSLEGRFIGAGYQLGAVDAKTFGPWIKEKFGYDLRSGIGVTANDQKLAMAELKTLFAKQPRLSNTIGTYKDAELLFKKADSLTKDRFANIISYLYAIVGLPKNAKQFQEVMTYCYFSSKKLTTGACLYTILQ